MDSKTIGFLLVGIIVGAALGYGVGYMSTSGMQQQVNSLQTQISGLQIQVTGLQSDKSSLQGQVSSLQGDKTTLERRVAELEAIHTYTVGSVLTTLSGGYEDRTGPAFHIPAGHVKIVVELTSLGEIRGFYLYLYEIGQSYLTWHGMTENAGTWTNYVYSLSAGDYYLEVGCVNFNWRITVYVYG